MSLAESGVIEATTITLHFELKGGAGKEKTIFVLDENDFDHSFDWDFSHRRYTNSNKIFYRGNREYIRPHGWVRIGLNVKDKYPDMAWIGGRKRPSKYESAEGEMAVSYHGTKKKCLRYNRIKKCLFRLRQSVRLSQSVSQTW